MSDLHEAVKQRDYEGVKHLLEVSTGLKKDLTELDERGYRPLDYAIALGYREVRDLLIGEIQYGIINEPFGGQKPVTKMKVSVGRSKKKKNI